MKTALAREETMGWYPSSKTNCQWDEHDKICQWWLLFAVHDVQSHKNQSRTNISVYKANHRRFLILHFGNTIILHHFSLPEHLNPNMGHVGMSQTQWFHISKSSAVPWKMHKQDEIQVPWQWTFWGMGKFCCENMPSNNSSWTNIYIYIDTHMIQ